MHSDRCEQSDDVIKPEQSSYSSASPVASSVSLYRVEGKVQSVISGCRYRQSIEERESQVIIVLRRWLGDEEIFEKDVPAFNIRCLQC
jgi:hypothetical protein